MVPDQAAVVFWHESGKGCLSAQSAWEVIEEVGIANEDGRMPMLAKQRSPVGLYVSRHVRLRWPFCFLVIRCLIADWLLVWLMAAGACTCRRR